MKIAVEPSVFRVPGQGNVTINQLEVRVASYSLGGGATSFYDLQTLQNGETLSYGLVGNCPLTEDQFNNWGTDDIYFANCIAVNLNLVPVSPSN